MRHASSLLFVACAAAAACSRADANSSLDSAVARTEYAAPTPGYVVDSAIPPLEMLDRFRIGLDPVARLDDHAAPSRRILIERFVRAVAARDTASLRAMSLSRAEFAYLYYPSTQYVRPPYETAPDVLWQLMHTRSESGMKRLVTRLGDAPITVLGDDCEPTPAAEGRNHFLRQCVLRFRRAGADAVETRRLFGSIIERDGRYKFVSYANDF